MKKFYFLTLFFTVVSFVNAQFTENFDAATTLPMGWSVINNGGANGWQVTDTPDGGALSGNNVMQIIFDSTAHDDYLISPALAVVAGTADFVSFNVRSRSSFFLEPYEVLLSTTGTNATDFNVVLQAESEAPSSWTKIDIPLDAYVGQTVYLAVRATGTNEFELYLDDFSFTTFVPHPNDDCADALNIDAMVNPSGSSTMTVTGDNTDASPSAEVAPSAGCSDSATDPDDIWFELTVPATGGFVFDQISTPGISSVIEVYTGTCGNLTAYAPEQCLNSSAPLTFSGLTPGSTVFIRYWDYLSNDEGAFEFSVEELPSCLEVANIAAGNVTGNSAELSWNASPSGESMWEYVVQPTGTGVPSAAGTSSSSNSNVPVMGLSGGTSYEVYVRAACSASDFGAWVGPFNFATTCTTVTESTDYDMGISPPTVCWSEAGSGELADGPSTSSSSSDWRSGRAYTNAASQVVNSNSMNIFSNVDREWLLSPVVDASMLNSANDMLEVEVALTDFDFVGTVSDATNTSTMGSDDQVVLLITRDSGASWQALETWDASNEPSVTGTTFTFPLQAETGMVQFAFFASDGTVDDTEDSDFHVGKFNLMLESLGTVDLTRKQFLNIYPNPTTGLVNIDVEGDVKKVNILSFTGKLLMTTEGKNTIDMSALPAGNYLVQVTNAKGIVLTKKLIKK